MATAKTESVNTKETVKVRVNPATNVSTDTAYTVRWDEDGKTQVETVRNTERTFQIPDGKGGTTDYKPEPVTVPRDHPLVDQLLSNKLILEVR